MNTDLDKLKDALLKANIVDDEKEVALQLLGKIDKELKNLNFRLSRNPGSGLLIAIQKKRSSGCWS